MQFAPQQEQALSAVDAWLKRVKGGDKSQLIFRLFGFAGTGKTTLAKHLAAGVDGTVLFAAFTGKATHVLASKGCPNTSTIHQLIYTPKEKSRARLRELLAQEAELKAKNPQDPKLEPLQQEIAQEQANMKRPMWQLNLDSPLRHASLLVVDECSMVDETIACDLLTFEVPILALGDPAQLPPVKGTGYFTNAPADFMLTDIHRQASDNPIIEMSRIVREGGILKPGNYGSSSVVRHADWDKTSVFRADQLLVGKNATRKAFNHRFRFLQGRENPYPVPGDKLVCLRNNHEQGLLNGSLWTVDECIDPGDGQLALSVLGEQGERVTTSAHACYFHGQEPEWYEKKDADEFDYGYALTVHKSQGSQWDHVLLFDEWFRPDRKQWLYTGITRAAETLQIIKMS